MKAAALRDLLAALPDDTVVTIQGHHVQYVVRNHPRRLPVLSSQPCTCDCGHQHKAHSAAYVDHPASIDLGSTVYGARASAPEPPVRYSGRWNRDAKAAIDQHSEDPDA